MAKKGQNRAFVTKTRKGQWVVQIDLSDGKTVIAEPGTGAQKVIFDRPQNVPRDLRYNIVPKLIEAARLKQLRGE